MEVSEVPGVPGVPDGRGAAPDAVPGPSRRRGRTALIVVGAAVLGIVAGTCAGYLVQAERKPTRLPSLSQPSLGPAKGDGPEPLSAARDRRVRTDGDLRELLLKKPRGARAGDWSGDDGWLDMAAYADTFEEPAGAFTDLVEEEFRRAAVTTWLVGRTYSVEIRLVQYRQEEFLAASDAAESGYYWAEKEPDTRSWSVPGTGDGMAYVHTRPDTEPGYLPIYTAEAHAWRGDIAMQIWVADTKPIPKSKIMDLAERQMERL